MSNEDQLKRIVDRMDEASRLTIASARKLASDVELVKELASQDRVQVARLLILMQRILEVVDKLEHTSQHVAEDLAASTSRADSASDIPGCSADAALCSPVDEEAHKQDFV